MGLFGNRNENKTSVGENKTSDESEETYDVEISCDNCGEETRWTDIPKGKTVRTHLKDEICDYCRCNIIRGDLK